MKGNLPAGELEGVFGQLSHAVPVLPPPGRHGEHLLDDRDPSVVAQLPVELDALPRQLHGEFVVAGEICGAAAARAARSARSSSGNLARAVRAGAGSARGPPSGPACSRGSGARPRARDRGSRRSPPPSRVPPRRSSRSASAQLDVRPLRSSASELGVAGDLEHPLGMTPAQIVFEPDSRSRSSANSRIVSSIQ